MLRSVITLTKPVLPYLRSVMAIHTQLHNYMCEAVYDNAQIQLQPGPCLTLR